jgi:predicted DNA-binding transcriptional regulator AlpA
MSTDRLLRLPAVRELIPLSRAAIYLKIQRKEFPAPIKLGQGRASFWRERDIADYLEKQGREVRKSEAAKRR